MSGKAEEERLKRERERYRRAGLFLVGGWWLCCGIATILTLLLLLLGAIIGLIICCSTSVREDTHAGTLVWNITNPTPVFDSEGNQLLGADVTVSNGYRVVKHGSYLKMFTMENITILPSNITQSLVYIVSITKIPADYRPLKPTFCPLLTYGDIQVLDEKKREPHVRTKRDVQDFSNGKGIVLTTSATSGTAVGDASTSDNRWGVLRIGSDGSLRAYYYPPGPFSGVDWPTDLEVGWSQNGCIYA